MSDVDVIILEEDEIILEEETFEVGEIKEPILIIDGVKYEEELIFLMNGLNSDNENRLIDLYFRVEGTIKNLIKVELTIDTILILKYLGYSIILQSPSGDIINLNDESEYYRIAVI